MRLWELAIQCRVYSALGYDRSYKSSRDACRTGLDFSKDWELDSLVEWLWAWGCRQFVKVDQDEARASIADWASVLPDDSAAAGAGYPGA